MTMKHFRKLFFICLIFSQTTFAQTTSQVEELKQISSDIETNFSKIAKHYAEVAAYGFFSKRVEFVHQTNGRCMQIVQRLNDLAGQLSQPSLFNQTYSSPQDAFAALQTVTTLALNDQSILRQVDTLRNEFEFEKSHIGETGSFLDVADDRIIAMFPRPSDLPQDYGYQAHLISMYRQLASQNRSKILSYISKCGGANLNLNDAIQERTRFFSDFSQKLADYYVANATDQFVYQLEERSKPRSDLRLSLRVMSALDQLDKRYRDAALYEKDYLKTVSMIDSYEGIGFIILTRVVPLSANPIERAECQLEINKRIQNAKTFKETILKKRTPSQWLEERLRLVQTKINSGSYCSPVCRQKIDDAKILLTAAQILELQSTDLIYVVLGNQVLDGAI